MWSGTWSIDHLWLHRVQLRQRGKSQGDATTFYDCRCSCMICLLWKWDVPHAFWDFSPLQVSAFPMFPVGSWIVVVAIFWLILSKGYTFHIILPCLCGAAVPIAFCWVSSCPPFWCGWRCVGSVMSLKCFRHFMFQWGCIHFCSILFD